MVNEPYISIGLAFITSLTWGINAHILKKGVAEENPFLGVAIRSIFAFPILFLITFLWRGIEGFTGYANQEVLFFTILGSTLFATGDILYLVGLKKYPVNMLVPIVATYPIIAIFILIITGSEEVSPTVIFGTVIVIFGIGLVTNGDIAGILNYKILSLGVLNALFYGFSVYYIKIALSFDTTDAISVSGIRT
ncbi:MAG: DMT family transporter, partial [Candidatus Heimdallarchaeota archaeon]|nr:DMT family transporter [Candidatus Heimdallarchaeota archaeon]